MPRKQLRGCMLLSCCNVCRSRGRSYSVSSCSCNYDRRYISLLPIQIQIHRKRQIQIKRERERQLNRQLEMQNKFNGFPHVFAFICRPSSMSCRLSSFRSSHLCISWMIAILRPAVKALREKGIVNKNIPKLKMKK